MKNVSVLMFNFKWRGNFADISLFRCAQRKCQQGRSVTVKPVELIGALDCVYTYGKTESYDALLISNLK